MNNYKIPKRRRTTLTDHHPLGDGNGATEDPKDSMERVSILQEPFLENNELATNYWTRNRNTASRPLDNSRVNPSSHVAPVPGSSQSSSLSTASEPADDAIRSAEIKPEVQASDADEQNDTDTEPVTGVVPVIEPRPLSSVPVIEPRPLSSVPVIEPRPLSPVPVIETRPLSPVPVIETRPLSPVPSSTTSGYNSSEISGRYSLLDSPETSDEDTTDDEEDDKDVLTIGVSRKERKEINRWNRLLFRRQ